MLPVEVDGKTVLGFDTGFDSRSFAQAKFAQFITEPGLIIGGGKIEFWKASGVIEKNTMIVWGPLFQGERLDYILGTEDKQDTTLAAISRWIQAVVTWGENSQYAVPLWPCAAIIGENGIFFAPPSLARYCVLNIENGGRYVHPDLQGLDGAAFCAAAMLYHVLTGAAPFAAANESLLHQDMREGNFLPIRFALPGLNPRLAAAIQNALEPLEKRINKSVTGKIAPGAALLDEMLAVLQSIQADLVQPLSEENLAVLEKEKAQFLKIQTASVTTKRFVMRNAVMLLGGLAALVVTVLIIAGTVQSRAGRPTTAGMEPAQVIETFYDAIGELDHLLMEACVIGKAGKNDINMVINLFVITKMRQSYEMRNPPMIISARQWQEKGGGPLDDQVIGVTDLHTDWLSGSTDSEIRCRVNYTLWVPAVAADDDYIPETEIDERLPRPYHRSDLITLVRKKGNWRIAEMIRE